MRVLIIALPGIGDALLSTPAIHTLRERYQDAQIDVLCMFRGTKEILVANKDISNVIYWDFINASWIKSLNFVISLRKKYDVCINIYPQNRREYNIISYLIGAPKRMGIQYLRRDKRNLGWLLNCRIREDDSLHCVEENYNLLEFFGINNSEIPPLQLTITQDFEDWSKHWLQEQNISGADLVIGIHAGTAIFKNHLKRRWEPEKFTQLGNALIDKYNARILLFGGPEETELRETINNRMDRKGVVVRTDSLMQSIAIMKRCNIFVSNDSALMHIAGALQLPTLGIFGPTNETYVHPWRTKYKIVHTDIECRPCFYYSPKPLTCYRSADEQFKCIHDLSVEMVLNSTKELLTKKGNLVDKNP